MSEAEFRALFSQESAGQLDRLSDGALRLEAGDAGEEVVASLFRDAHTLKSSAGLVGLPEVSALAHALEDVLSGLRAGRRQPDAALADALLLCVDGLRALIAAGLAGEQAPDVAGAAHAALAALDTEPPTAPPPRSRPAPKPFDDEEFRALFVQEAESQLTRLVDLSLSLEDSGGDPEVVAGMFRTAHTVKGSSSLVGYAEVTAVAHELEDLLSAVRSGERPADAPLVDVVLGVVDRLREVIHTLHAGEDPGAAVAAALALLRGEGSPAGGATSGPATSAAEAVGEAAPTPTPVAPSPAAVPAEPDGPPPPPSPAEADVVPVALDRLDRLVRTSGEAVAAQLRLAHLIADRIEGDPDAEAASVAVRRLLRALQQETLATRMTSLAAIAAPLRRAVRDLARSSGKQVRYELVGERVELDRAVLDGLRDPLLHLVRNAVDHGIEPPAAREAAGKPATGCVRVTARRHGPEVLVEVEDDGRGLDLDQLREKAGQPGLEDVPAADLVFTPGLSTAAEVTAVSGRGVGMDAVRTAVEGLRGRVDVRSRPGVGCTFTLSVPLTLAVLPCVYVEAGGQRYALPSQAATAVVDDPAQALVGLEGGAAVWVGGDVVPLTPLAEVLGIGRARDRGPAIVLTGSAGSRHALRVDAVTGQRPVTVKELGSVVPGGELVSGASIEADGSVVLVLDAAALVERAGRRRPAGLPGVADPPPGASAPEAPAPDPAPAADGPTSVLVVDDALTVRELQRSILMRAGFEVRTAVDGQDALARLAEHRPDLVISDVEMPRLDGYGLVEAIRSTPTLASVPVLMVTSRGSEEDRRRGLEAGADAYLVKQDFDEARLLAAVGRLLGHTP